MTRAYKRGVETRAEELAEQVTDRVALMTMKARHKLEEKARYMSVEEGWEKREEEQKNIREACQIEDSINTVRPQLEGRHVTGEK